MKGVIAAIAPYAIIDDAAHDIAPGDVHAASWALGAYWRLYPAGTVHVAVVDPGVGTARRALAIEAADRFIIAPDNGIVTAVLRDAPLEAAVEISAPHLLRADVSATFHGRDVFAPAAAHVAAGVPLVELGTAVSDPVLLREAEPVCTATDVRGAVVHVDRFGNLVTNIPAAAISSGSVAVGTVAGIAVVATYADVRIGECAGLVGSRGRLEVSVRDGSAALVLGAGIGTAVVWSADPADLAPDV